jgi:hypothetical protein
MISGRQENRKHITGNQILVQTRILKYRVSQMIKKQPDESIYGIFSIREWYKGYIKYWHSIKSFYREWKIIIKLVILKIFALCIDVWMHRCMDVWMHRCMDVWMYGCMDASMYRFKWFFYSLNALTYSVILISPNIYSIFAESATNVSLKILSIFILRYPKS